MTPTLRVSMKYWKIEGMMCRDGVGGYMENTSQFNRFFELKEQLFTDVSPCGIDHSNPSI